MEGGGSWAAGEGRVLGAAQEPRGQDENQTKEAGAAAESRQKGAGGGGGGGGAMKFRVRAQAPHGVGALLLIGGAAVVGAAVLAWRRRSRHAKKGGDAVDQPERRLPAKEEALEGGVVEDGKVQGGSLLQKLDQCDEKLSAGNTDIGSGSLDGNVSEESHQIHKDDEHQVHKDDEIITADQLESTHEERIGENSVTNPVEIHTHDLESKHEEKIDENSGSNPVVVHTHDLESKHEEKIDENSGSNHVEVHTHDLNKEHVEKVDQKSSSNHVDITAHEMCQDNELAEKIDHIEGIDHNSSSIHDEISTHDMCQENEHAEKIDPIEGIDHNSSSNHDEFMAHDVSEDNEPEEKIDHIEGIDNNSSSNPVEIIMREMVTVCLVSGSLEKVEEDSSKKDIEKEIAQNDHKDMEAPDQSKLCIKGPGIILSKHNDEIQEAESMENTPTAQLMMHEDLDDMVTDTVTETEDNVTETEDIVTGTEDTVTETEEEAKQGERTITDKSELEQDDKKDLVELVELASSPALSALVKPTVKKGPGFPRPNETGMKIEQDCTNGEPRDHTDLISKGGAIQREGAMATMDRRSSALVVLALIFALAMGITIIVRLYAPARATKLQMNLP